MSELDVWHGQNAPAPLTTPTYDGSGEAVHPDVIDTVTGWSGYRYWMAMTPYPGGDSTYENPSILASSDGDTWEVPVGLTNPVHAPASGFAPDPDIVLHDGTMYLFWASHHLSTSTDGVNWAAKETLISAPGEVSPAVHFDGTTWRMWSVQTDGDPNELRLRTATAADGPWSAPTACTVTNIPSDRDLWHVEVCRVGERWWGLINLCDRASGGGTDASLHLARSDNGIDWELGTIEVIPRRPGEWDGSHIYRSAMVPIMDGATLTGFEVWYSALSLANVWHIGRTTIAPTS